MNLRYFLSNLISDCCSSIRSATFELLFIRPSRSFICVDVIFFQVGCHIFAAGKSIENIVFMLRSD